MNQKLFNELQNTFGVIATQEEMKQILLAMNEDDTIGETSYRVRGVVGWSLVSKAEYYDYILKKFPGQITISHNCKDKKTKQL